MSLHQFLLALHLLAMGAGVGIGLGNVINARIAARHSGDIAKGLALHRVSMLPYSDTAITVLLLTGGLLIWFSGGVPGQESWFHAKMAAVVLLMVFYVTLRVTVGQMRRTGNMALGKRLAIIGPLISLMAAVTVVCAVMAFSV